MELLLRHLHRAGRVRDLLRSVGDARAQPDHRIRDRRTSDRRRRHDGRNPLHDQPGRGRHARQTGVLLRRYLLRLLDLGIPAHSGDQGPHVRGAGHHV